MEGLLDRFSVERFITTRDVAEHPSQRIQALLSKVSKQRIPIDLWSAGSGSHRDNSYGIRAIYPNRAPPVDRQKRNSDNAKSLCLLIEFADRRILLPGDLESPGTESLTSGPSICIDVLMAPHHGSLTTNQDGLIAWSQASTVVISGSHRSLDPRVFEVYSPDGQKVLHTARDHAIRLRIDPAGSMRWYQWQEKAWSQMKD
jgi:competence protein ComEC